MNRLLTLAMKFAPQGKHRVNSYRMAALVVRGGAIVSLGTNLGTDNRRHHAEARALRPNNDYRGAKMYVARDGGGCSKPCGECWEKILAAGISQVTYLNLQGISETLKIET